MLKTIVTILCLFTTCYFLQAQGSAVEICDNGIDDDNDQLIDLNDDNCPCTIVEPISLIRNPSFEDLNCCPRERSQLNCADGWIQASEPTTDLIHTCDWMGWDEFPPPMPFPDGEAIMGFRDGFYNETQGLVAGWKEYAGACLINPLEADSTYRFQFDLGFGSRESSPSITITIFGTTSCEFLPFGENNPDLGCPTNGPNWQLLGSRRIEVGQGNKWVNTNIIVTPPEDIRAIAIGPPCSSGLVNRSLYYFFDNLILADIKLFDLAIEEVNNPCSQDFTLAVPKADNLDYQWYFNGVALVGESAAELSQNYGEGEYQIRITEQGLCRVSGKFNYQIPKIYSSPTVVICEEDVYEFGGKFFDQSGTYLDTFTSQLGCDSIVSLELKVLGEIVDTINVEIFKGDSYTIGTNTYDEEGEYLNILKSSLGCDSLVLLNLNLFTVYAPNIFSPNDDGFNDTFTIQGDNSLFTLRNLRVYDQWGNLLYEGREWNGEYRGEKVREGVYTYTGQLFFANGKQEAIQGVVTLVR